MILATTPLIKTTSKAALMQLILAIFGLMAGLVASVSVLLNDIYFWGQSPHYITPYLFLTAFLLALLRKPLGLMGCIFLLPLSAGLGGQLNAYMGTHFLGLPNPGLDLVAGFFLGSLVRFLPDITTWLKSNDKGKQFVANIGQLLPWPVALVIVAITLSTAIAISRNVYQSAAATSFKGLLFNLVHFRPIGWHDDYMPIADWIAYALAVAIIAVVLGYLKERPNKNQIIFRPLIAGLIVAAVMGIVQAITGLGLPESLLVFRKDFFGHAAIGFQPDLHAYAGHMLLGAVGLWGYFSITHSKLERQFILCAVTLSWVGLVLSKSRALFLLAFIGMFIWLLFYLWKTKRHLLIPFALASSALFGSLLIVLLNYAQSLNGIPVLSWLGEFASALKDRDLTSWSLVSGLFGARFEIWEGALRMWWEFPLMGVGQGNFYRLSDIASFSKSHYLILNGGENAHNYFLQTLTETGLVGIAAFSIVLITPLIKSSNKKILLPSVVALVSLFLGNIFAHSFLVRENLLLGSILLSSIYLDLCVAGRLSGEIRRLESFKLQKAFILFLSLFIFLSYCILEVYNSFNKFPFEYGRFCFVDSSMQKKQWTSGNFNLTIPSRFSRVEIEVAAPHIEKDQILILRVGQVDHNGHKSENRFNINISTAKVIEFRNNHSSSDGQSHFRFSVSQCFTPRNKGLNLDSRRLGVLIIENPRLYD
jgi:O-antigen ligase